MRRAEPPDMTGQDLTSRQRKIVQVIEDSMQRRGYSPTLREIGEQPGLRVRRVSLTNCPGWRRRGA